MTTEQTSDPTLWRYPEFYSANHRTHIRNLESALAEEKSKLDHCLTANEQGTLQWWIQKHDKLMRRLAGLLLKFERHESQLEEARWLLGNFARRPLGWSDRLNAWLSDHTPTGKEK